MRPGRLAFGVLETFVTDVLPAWHPPRPVLELTELVLSGALPGFPVPLRLPDRVAAEARDAGGLVLEDDEGTPVATLIGERPLAGQPFTHGPLRSRRRTPSQIQEQLSGPVLAVPVRGPLTRADVARIRERAVATGAEILWLVVVGAGRAPGLSPEALLRAVRGACDDAATSGAAGSVVPVAVPLLPGIDDVGLLTEVGRGYGAAEIITASGTGSGAGADGAGGTEAPRRVLGDWHPASARELDRADLPAHRRGVTVFFTGLSGSGKSTIARGLAERLLDDGRRPVTLLDGDEVRRLLSHGLGFSRADRDLNIRRIGFVAAEVTRHGGLAICAPIAPFAAVRHEVRERVQEVGDFVLVHVSTPLTECERRDRKGLYARARKGLVPEFTGISSPYEPPRDADLRIDTTGLGEAEAVERVWRLLVDRGYLG